MGKCNYETYRYTREVCQVENQSMVECRFPGAEMVSVLAVQARVVESECVCADGEVKYNGKLLLGVVYEDANRKICRAERGAEFFYKAAHEEIAPACFARGCFTPQNIAHRREGASTYVSVVIGASIKIYAQAEAEYLAGGEEVVVKKETGYIAQVSAVAGETEETDDFDVSGAVDVLLHEEQAHLTACRMRMGEVEIEGEICYDVCVLQEEGGVVRYERILPVRMTLPCEEGREEDGVKAAIEVRHAQVSLTFSEEGDRARIAFVGGLYADCTVYKKVGVEMATDAFSITNKLTLKRQKVAGRYLFEQKNEVLRVAGTAACNYAEDGGVLLCAFLPKVEFAKRGETLEGVLEANALVKDAEGGYKVCLLSLPFALDVKVDEKDEIDCMVTGLSVRNFGKEPQLEGTIKLSVAKFEQVEAEYITEAVEGESLAVKDCAITVFVPKKGDGVWEVAKKMGISPEEVEKCNPDVVFPVEEGARIVVYRQKR
ncbi:MAG: hypothetical protein IJY11_02665 [Clostridia bacterium]|nr:hypothetical protein [Clostridia bacterium]